MGKVVTANEAVSHINDNDIIAVNGMLLVNGCPPFYKALEERFLTTGKPSNLTIYPTCSIAVPRWIKGHPGMINRLAHTGLVGRFITPYYGFSKFRQKIAENEIEAYLIPQGTISQMLHSAARRMPRTLTKVGLHTFVDPRYGGGRVNDVSQEDLCSLVEIDGEEYLSYKTVFPDVCLIRGSTVDRNGNISFEQECATIDALTMAIATKNNGGTVIVQVKQESEERKNPQMVQLPSALVDYVYLDPTQTLALSGNDTPVLNGTESATESDYEWGYDIYLSKLPESVKAVLNRACVELYEGAVVNLGLGIPYSLGTWSRRLGYKGIKFTNEVGLFGGSPNPVSFGLNFDTDMMMSQCQMQNFYEGGGLDISFAGALEIDIHGNVNVLKGDNDRLFGIGGFNSITQFAKKVVFCLNFFDKQGRCKIVDDVKCINYNGAYKPTWQKAVYVTERCTFELENGKLRLAEIAPGYTPDDVLPYLPQEVKETYYGTD